MGVSAGALQFMTKDALAKLTDNPGDRIPRLKVIKHANHEAFVDSIEKEDPIPLETEPIYYTISRDKWAQVECPLNGAERINQMIRRIDDSGLVRAGMAIDNKEERRMISVAHTTLKKDGKTRRPEVSIDEIREALPPSIDGTAGTGKNRATIENIPVKIERTEAILEYYSD